MGEIPEVSGSTIGYRTVADALEALKGDSTVQTRVENGWTLVTDDAHKTIWSFAPSSDPAYPAVAKRTVVERGGAVSLDMRVLCQSGKLACDNFVRQFEALNDRVREYMQKQR